LLFRYHGAKVVEEDIQCNSFKVIFSNFFSDFR
jgi:hypothetical protein